MNRSRSTIGMAAIIVLAVICIFTQSVFNNACATEGGGGSYPNGAEDFLAGMLPPPGTYFINYFSYYRANNIKDNSGDTVPVHFRLNATADVFRFIHITKHKIFGADWGFNILVPLVDVHVERGPSRDNKTGIGDITIDPILLRWQGKNWHCGAGLDVTIPSGAYSKFDLANIGRNYWTIEPIFAVTYLSNSGFEASVKFMYDFNTRNNATKYQSGQEFHFDYTLGKRIENFHIGVGGYFYKQITDDKQNGRTLKNMKGQAVGIGPQAMYRYKNISFTFKYHWETLVKNKTDGERVWCKFGYAF